MKASSKTNKLKVALAWGPGEEEDVGFLAANSSGQIAFEFNANFLSAHKAQISPFKLEDKRGLQFARTERTVFEGLFGVFWDSLPDGWGILLMERSLRCLGFAFETASPLDKLAWIGQRGLGALCYEPSIQPNEGTDFNISIAKFAEESAKVVEGHSTQMLQKLVTLGGSPGGARPKICVAIEKHRIDDHIFCGKIISGVEDILPENFEHWIVKFRARDDSPEDSLAELVYSLTAKHVGINVEPTALFEDEKGSIWFGMRRFDRDNAGKRLHMHSLAGLLHANFRLPSLDYESLLKATFVLTRSATEMEQAFRMAVFNGVFHNRDDHAKNFSFLMNHKFEWKIAPAYDLTWSHGMGGEHATSYGGEGKNPAARHYLKLAENVGIAAKRAQEIIDEISEGKTFAKKMAKAWGLRKFVKKLD